jgi:hypothetical protein
VLCTDSDLTFQDERSWPDDSGEKLDGEFLPETPLEAAWRASCCAVSVLALAARWGVRQVYFIGE